MDAWIAAYNIAGGQTGYLYELSTDASGVIEKAVKEKNIEPEMAHACFYQIQYQAVIHRGIRKLNVSQILGGIRSKHYFRF